MQTTSLFLYLGALFSTFPYFQGYKMDKVSTFLERSGIKKTQFSLSKARNGRMLVTQFDDFRELLVLSRQILINRTAKDLDRLLELNWKMGKIQKPIPQWKKFPCKLNSSRSKEPPNTVHQLRPGDIDVVAAIGDSLSSGNGMIIKNIFDIGTEFRGLAFSGGGMADWRMALTLPNILKVFNPKLYGYSISESLTVSRDSRLNIAEPMVMSRDLVYQAHVLIARLKNDPHINFKNHWKLLTIFTGHNDICSDMCHHDDMENFLRLHERDLIDVFTLLKNNVPRLVINLLPVTNVITTLYRIKNIPFTNKAVQKLFCHCIFSDLLDAKRLEKASNYITRWQAIDKYVAELPEFQTDDFIILYHPFTANIGVPTLATGETDLRYMANDYFHFSQLGHASMANILWNSMLIPKNANNGTKFIFSKPFEKFECPTDDRPFIATK